MIVALDASPLSLMTQRSGVPDAEACRTWVNSLLIAGVQIVVPMIADFEVRRELLRAGKLSSVGRLDAIRGGAVIQYLPISDAALLEAAVIWAEARKRGLPTANPAELDCDVVFVGILLTSNIPRNQIVVATSNVGHLSRFLPADAWQNIRA